MGTAVRDGAHHGICNILEHLVAVLISQLGNFRPYVVHPALSTRRDVLHLVTGEFFHDCVSRHSLLNQDWEPLQEQEGSTSATSA